MIVVTRNLVIITPALEGGGIEKTTPILIRSLTKLRKISVLWIGVNKSSSLEDLPRTRSISMGRKSGDGVFCTLRTLFQVQKLVGSVDKPTLLVNGEMAELFAAFFVWNVEIICVEHASRPWTMSRGLGRVIRLILKRKCARWVTVNSRQEIIWPSIMSFVHIPNPIVFPESNFDDREIGLVHIGRLVEAKCTDLACDASVRTGIPLDVYGDGVLYEGLAEKYKKNGQIRFHGFVGNAWSLVGLNKVLISSSTSEGDGRNVAEAIVRRQPLLLRDTEDHRRFGLSDECYFNSTEELCTKLEMYRAESFSQIRPSGTLAMQEIERRDPMRVATLWTSLLDNSG